MENQTRLRELLINQFTGKNAHVDLDTVTEKVPFSLTGVRVEGLPHSIWELVEHIRIAQYDIVEFSRNPNYESPTWPEGYWPPSPEPESRTQWEQSLDAIRSDKQAMVKLIQYPQTDLLKPFEHGSGQTLFRETMLIIDHNAYHIGQIVQLCRLLGCW